MTEQTWEMWDQSTSQWVPAVWGPGPDVQRIQEEIADLEVSGQLDPELDSSYADAATWSAEQDEAGL